MSAISDSQASPPVSSLLETKAPQAGVAEAEAIGLAHFGVAAKARLLTSERDLNFRLSGQDGSDFILKITNAAEDPAVTDLQTQALLHIAARRPDLPAPRVVPTTNGAPAASLVLAGATHIIRLLTYLQGEPLHATEGSATQRQALGCFLAELGQALEQFQHPAANHEILWDLKHAAKLEPLTIHIKDDEHRRAAQRAFMVFCKHVEPVQASLRSQIVHNDFQPHNVLVDPTNHEQIAGVIDFGDIVRTPLVNDVAVAASYQMLEGEEPSSGGAEFAAAYHRVRPLREQEVDLLFDLVAVRHAMTVTITEWRASRYPENRDYILRNHPRAARGLLAALPRDRGRSIFRRACGME